MTKTKNSNLYAAIVNAFVAGIQVEGGLNWAKKGSVVGVELSLLALIWCVLWCLYFMDEVRK